MAYERTLRTVTLEELLGESEEQEPLVLDDDIALIDGLPSLDDEHLASWLAAERAMTQTALELTRES